MNEFFNATEIGILANLSESAIRNRIARGLFPAATHRRNGRHVWDGETVRDEIAKMRQPVPITGEDRRSRLPASCEAR